jgi:acyl transferase domain-containing protein/phosphopantetheinyl transferase/acyl carrier protein
VSAPVRTEPVAIVGMACIFPGAPDLRSYWRNILGKVDAVGEPPDDWHPALASRGLAGVASEDLYCTRGGYLRDLARFNPVDYGVMPNSIAGGDPDQFLALRVAHEALADAGYLDRPAGRERAEVVLGRGAYINRGYTNLMQHGLVVDQTIEILRRLHPEHTPEALATIRRELKASLPPFNPETAPGLVPNVVSGRIANRLDLMGASYTVDAACASALAALEIGVRDLQTGKCDLALVGGVHTSTPPPIHMVFCQLNALSRRGQIRPFARDADGTILGEGVGIVVLKRLDDARRDGDRVYAVIRGVGVASDGRALGLLAPRLDGEVLALRRAYEPAAIPPATVGLIEAHGTATPVGDATEIQALRAVFGERDGARPWCALGSVKSMIGHTLPAAGIAGVIKAALALYHRVLPPTLHCEEPDPKLELDRTPFYVNTETRPWIHGGPAPRRAGVNAFGFGGINAHAVLEEPPGAGEPEAPSLDDVWDSEALVLEGESRADLVERAERLRRFLAERPDVRLPDVAHTLGAALAPCAAGRPRLALVATTVADARDKLAHAAERLRDPRCRRIKDVSGIYFFAEPLGPTGKVAFLFPGEGSQYLRMLADLCRHFPEVRACFDLIDRAFAPPARPVRPSELIFPPPGGDATAAERELWAMDTGAEAVFIASQALLRLLGRLELRPDMVVGHSTGEYSALLAAGAIEVPGDAELAEHIVRLHAVYERLAAAGEIPAAPLLAVGAADPATLAAVLEEGRGALHVAMDNCPHQLVLCAAAPVEPLLERLRRAGAVCTPLPFGRAYHTPLFERVAAAIGDFFAGLPVGAPRLPLYSCVTTGPYPDRPDEIRQLAAAQWARPVRFRETVEAMYRDGARVFVEVGPRNNLTGFVEDTLRGRPYVAVAANSAHRSGITQLNHLVALLAAHAVPLRLERLYRPRGARRLFFEGQADPDRAATAGAGAPLALGLPTLAVAGPLRPAKGDDAASPVGATSNGVAGPAPGAPGPTPPEVVVPAGGTASTNGHHPGLGRHHPSGPPQPRTEAVAPAATPQGARAPVMEAYLSTMDDFLAVQEDVMRAFLQGAPARDTPAPAKVVEPPAPQVAAPTAASPAPAADAPAPGPSPAPGGPSIAQALLAIVSDRTGYPVEMLDPTAQIEADLGIDSIKRVEILGAFRQATGLLDDADVEVLTRVKTLRQLIDVIAERTGGPAPPPPAPAAQTPGSPAPLAGRVSALTPGREVVTLREVDLNDDLFLEDHTLGRRVSVFDETLRGLPVMPLTMSVEMLAEVALLLEPGRRVVAMRDIRAHRWLAIDDRRVPLRIVARRAGADEIRAEVREDGTGAASTAPIIEGTVVVGDAYPEPPAVAPLPLRGERPSRWIPERLYSEVMFHGPRFQGVAAIDRWGEDGIEGTLVALPSDRLVRSTAAPALVTDPVLLDAAGQLVGYWIAEHVAGGDHVFPYRVAAIHFYGPALAPPGRARCQARIELVGESQVRSDLDVIGPDGRLRVRILGWEDKRFALPPSFYDLRLAPRDAVLSEPWTAPLAGRAEQALWCRRLDALPEGFLDSGGGLWRRVLAHLVLGRREREAWARLERPARGRDEWLLARAAAKDTVRQLLRDRYGLAVGPADVEIDADEHGRPVPGGPWLAGVPRRPALSLAHGGGLAVALAADGTAVTAVGIDVERAAPLREGFDQVAFTGQERALLAARDPAEALEWRLRFWCAKEALAKALGRGLGGRPQHLVVVDVDPPTGRLELAVEGGLARDLGVEPGRRFRVSTVRDGIFIAAIATLEGDQDRHGEGAGPARGPRV